MNDRTPRVYLHRWGRYSRIEIDVLRTGRDLTEQTQQTVEVMALREAQECVRTGRIAIVIASGVDYVYVTTLRSREPQVLGELMSILGDPAATEDRTRKWVSA